MSLSCVFMVPKGANTEKKGARYDIESDTAECYRRDQDHIQSRDMHHGYRGQGIGCHGEQNR